MEMVLLVARMAGGFLKKTLERESTLLITGHTWYGSLIRLHFNTCPVNHKLNPG
jgi:hypothetical protein